MGDVDLSKLATKEDLEKLSTKEDIKRLNERTKGVEREISRLSKIADRVDKGVSKLAIKVMENKEAIEKRVTREEFDEKVDALAQTVDEVLTISKRLDVERVATIEWLKRLETRIERNIQEIEKIKGKLAIG